MKSDILETFRGLIANRQAKIGIIGLGYVGLPLGVAFAKKGFSVIGYDMDKSKVDNINTGAQYIQHIPASDVAEIAKNGGFATTSPADLSKADAILICVPTPLTKQREPDISYVAETAGVLSKVIRPGQLIVLESTTYPGTTREVLLPPLEKSGLKAGEDFLLAYSPEREDPGAKGHSAHEIPKVVGGYTPTCLAAACALYDAVVPKTVPVSSPDVAEATKLMENIFRCVNIALVNELKQVFARMNIDVWEVIEAAKSKPFGFMPFYPGPGLGGHCIPIDPFYLTWKAREFDCSTRFIELAGEINTSMPEYVIAKVMEGLNAFKKSVNGSKLLLVGLAYKKDVDDTRESPSLRLMERLEQDGAAVDYHDPHIPSLTGTRERKETKRMSMPLTAETLRDYDAVIIATDHTGVDYSLIASEAQLVIDTRNIMPAGAKSQVVKA